MRGTDGRGENLALFYASSKDGRRFTPRHRIPTDGVPRHPQIALGQDGAIIVAWDEQSKDNRRIVVATSRTAGGGPRFARQAIGSDSGTYPLITSLADATLVAWTSGTSGHSIIQIERLPFRK